MNQDAKDKRVLYCVKLGETDEVSRRGSAVVYSVELARRGGPLGLTVAGTEDASQPVTISALTPGGLAERTGALHVGDRLLAINGHCLQGRRLSEAVEWLQGAGDRVTLQVSRGGSPAPCSTSSDDGDPELPQPVVPANPSVDSAVESWSSGGGPTSPTEYNADSGQSGGSPAPPLLPPPWRTADEDEVVEEDELSSPPRCATLPSRARAASPASSSCLPDVHTVTLRKDRVYEDFGFSLSDGLYERGVYVNRIRRGGPADLSGRLRPYDRILQVNDTRTQDFDCCLTVPLIATAGDTLELTVARNPFAALAPSPTGEDPWLCTAEEQQQPCVTESL
ncbi:hypothetical protein B566_EDAN014632 [Ephemera danica]|nr:hypothetical protein B566_EDAN014632 [Ephemera danica]